MRAAGASFALFALALSLIHVKPDLLGRRAGGPLACTDCGRSATGVPVGIWQPVSVGPVILRNETNEPVRLERVELLDVDPGLQLIGGFVVEPDGHHPLVGAQRGFPPIEPGGRTRPIRNYELAPAESRDDFVQVLLGVRLTRPGRAGARRIAVEYRAGGTSYRAVFEHSLWLCTDPSDRRRCIDPRW